ncbi:hypothetical protein [Curtobacterium sp. USHLN213]|uniref:hypothetical protein n=1 Tax=Curtobacterium sp. USHLN213 TaxID=3081255 RepID=UPI0030189E64
MSSRTTPEYPPLHRDGITVYAAVLAIKEQRGLRWVMVLCPLCGEFEYHEWGYPPKGRRDRQPGMRHRKCGAYASVAQPPHYYVVVPRYLWNQIAR